MKILLTTLILLSGCSTADRVAYGGAATGAVVGSLICPPATTIIGAAFGGSLGPLYAAREAGRAEVKRKAEFEPFESVI